MNREFGIIEYFLKKKYLFCNITELGAVIKSLKCLKLDSKYTVRLYGGSCMYTYTCNMKENLIFELFKAIYSDINDIIGAMNDMKAVDRHISLRVLFRVDIHDDEVRIYYVKYSSDDNNVYNNYQDLVAFVSDESRYLSDRSVNENDVLSSSYIDSRGELRKYRNMYVINDNDGNTCESNNNSKKEREENKMKDMGSLIPGLKVGKVSDENIKMSHLGIAVKNNEGTYVSYDRANNQIVDVDILSFDGDSFLFYMPVQLAAVLPGDTILHNGKPCHVTGINPLKGIYLAEGSSGEIMLTMNMFGFNFVTKIMSLIDFSAMNGGNPQANALWPLLLASRNGEDNDDAILALMLMQMNNPMMQGQGMGFNPLLLMAFAGNNNKGDGGNDMIKTIALMQMMQPQVYAIQQPVGVQQHAQPDMQNIQVAYHAPEQQVRAYQDSTQEPGNGQEG